MGWDRSLVPAHIEIFTKYPIELQTTPLGDLSRRQQGAGSNRQRETEPSGRSSDIPVGGRSPRRIEARIPSIGNNPPIGL